MSYLIHDSCWYPLCHGLGAARCVTVTKLTELKSLNVQSSPRVSCTPGSPGGGSCSVCLWGSKSTRRDSSCTFTHGTSPLLLLLRGLCSPPQLPSRPGQVSLSCPCVCLHCGSGKEILSQGLCDKITSVVKMQPVTKITESGDGLGWKGSSLGFAAPREAPWAHCWGSCAWFMWRRTGADSGGSSCEPAEPISSTTAVSHGHPA